ncbi:MAG: DUF1080 domain-containing protein [Saprospiraceae bacterium]|nr:DUF1080 domain-containing protein [Saprospiraceae bacterium]
MDYFVCQFKWSVVIFSLSLLSCNLDDKKMNNHEDTIHLFNGENLDGWYTYLKGLGKDQDPDEVFTVENGIIRISGETWGCITTEKEFENYHLFVEYKWGEKTFEPRVDRARDCGVLLHSTGVDGAYGDTWMYSIECQIIEGGTGDFLVVADGSENYAITSPVADEKQGSSWVYQADGHLETIYGGRINWYGRSSRWQDTIGFRGENDIEKPVGEWNVLECVAESDSLITKLNGVMVNEAIKVRPHMGKIQIQSEGAEIFIRKVDLILD